MQVARELSSEGAGAGGRKGRRQFAWRLRVLLGLEQELGRSSRQAGKQAERLVAGRRRWCKGRRERERRSGSGLGGARTTRAWAGWAGWARVGNGSDWAAEPLRWVPPAPTQLKMHVRPGRPGRPNSGSHVLLRAGAGLPGHISDGIRQGQSRFRQSATTRLLLLTMSCFACLPAVPSHENKTKTSRSSPCQPVGMYRGRELPAPRGSQASGPLYSQDLGQGCNVVDGPRPSIPSLSIPLSVRLNSISCGLPSLHSLMA